MGGKGGLERLLYDHKVWKHRPVGLLKAVEAKGNDIKGLLADVELRRYV